MVARRAHNPEVVGSNPAPAPNLKQSQKAVAFSFLRVMRPASVARWVSEAKTILRIVLVSGVAPSRSLPVELFDAENDMRRRPARSDNPEVVASIRPLHPI